jgi:MEMO1 family protein
MNSSNIRPAAVAGRFYPGNPLELRRLVGGLLAGAPRPTAPAPKALIAPHAGFLYSGPIAASAYSQLAPNPAGPHNIKRVVLLGPSHHVAFRGLAASSASAFATPLGQVPVDVEALNQALSLPGVSVLDEAHAREHCLEVQLPFLQTVLDQFSIVPLVAGEASAELTSRVLEALWNGPSTRLVVSSDLSHYQDFSTAQRLDGDTAEAIEALAPDRIQNNQACGHVPIRGLLLAARAHGLHARTLDLRNSGDTAGPRDRVVGYGAFAFGENLTQVCDQTHTSQT